MRGRGGRRRSRGRNTSKDRQSSNNRSTKNNERKSIPPTSRRARKPRKRKNSPDYSSEQSSLDVENVSESSDHIENNSDCDDPSYNPNTPAYGLNCTRHQNHYQEDPFYQMRSLYSRFPREQHRIIFLHLLVTIFLYLVIFPLINCVWTYLINVDDEIMNLFTFITETPSTTISSHIRRLNWLTLPAVNAECLSLLLAVILKDTLAMHWEGVCENFSLTEGIVGKVARRYRR